MEKPRAVVYLHVEHERSFLLGEALIHVGFALEERLQGPRPEDANAPLLVVMGGPMAVYEASLHPFLQTELEVLQQRLAAGRPSLGICLGSHLLAAAAGAQVHPGEAGAEIGILPVELTLAGQQDAPLSGLAGVPVAHWHSDTFTPVPGATLLASTPQYEQQAFRIGSSYGLQFHPELTAEALRSWIHVESVELERTGVDAAALSREAERLVSSQERCEAMLRHLCRQLMSTVR